MISLVISIHFTSIIRNKCLRLLCKDWPLECAAKSSRDIYNSRAISQSSIFSKNCYTNVRWEIHQPACAFEIPSCETHRVLPKVIGPRKLSKVGKFNLCLMTAIQHLQVLIPTLRVEHKHTSTNIFGNTFASVSLSNWMKVKVLRKWEINKEMAERLSVLQQIQWREEQRMIS